MALLKTKNNVVREQKICFAYALEPLFVFACFQLCSLVQKKWFGAMQANHKQRKKKESLKTTGHNLSWVRNENTLSVFVLPAYKISSSGLLLLLLLQPCFVRCFQLDLNTLKTITFVVLVLYRNPSLHHFLVKNKTLKQYCISCLMLK